MTETMPFRLLFDFGIRAAVRIHCKKPTSTTTNSNVAMTIRETIYSCYFTVDGSRPLWGVFGCSARNQGLSRYMRIFGGAQQLGLAC